MLYLNGKPIGATINMQITSPIMSSICYAKMVPNDQSAYTLELNTIDNGGEKCIITQDGNNIYLTSAHKEEEK